MLGHDDYEVVGLGVKAATVMNNEEMQIPYFPKSPEY